jgi:hypothetical protein
VLALNLAVGLEAGPLRAWSLARRGWQHLGAVTGKSLPECERRFIAAWLPAQPVLELPAHPTVRRRFPLFSLRT